MERHRCRPKIDSSTRKRWRRRVEIEGLGKGGGVRNRARSHKETEDHGSKVKKYCFINGFVRFFA
jgi:hypothetical protein